MKNTGFNDCWRECGLANPSCNWSAETTQGVVLTAWDQPGSNDPNVTEIICEGGKDWLQCIRGDWVNYPKGKKYFKHASDAMTSGMPARLIVISGRRWPRPSEVKRAVIRQHQYAVRITEVNADGFIRGQLITKDEYDAEIKRRITQQGIP